MKKRIRKQRPNPLALPAPREAGQVTGIGDLIGNSFGNTLAKILGGFGAPPGQRVINTPIGRPLWWCRKCGVSLGEWNPQLPHKQLYCPLCRAAMSIHRCTGIDPHGAVTVTAQPVIDATTQRPLIEAPRKADTKP